MTTEQRRAQLLAAGRRIFADRAYDQVSTDELAAATDTSKGLLYHYFGNKRGFYLATIQASATELLAATEFGDGPMGIANSLEGFSRFVAKDGRLFRAIVRGGIGSDQEVDALVGSVRQQLVERILGVMETPLSPDRIARVWGWLGFAEGLAIHWVEKRPFDEQALSALLLQTFVLLLNPVAGGAQGRGNHADFPS